MSEDKKYQMVTESEYKGWLFTNNTTACVIALTFKDAYTETTTILEYHEFEDLMELIKQIKEV